MSPNTGTLDCASDETSAPSRIPASNPHGPRRALEGLGLALEDLAFCMLEHEDQLFLAGRFEDVAMLAEWRRDVRGLADTVRKWGNGDEYAALHAALGKQ